jgi:hypothetical protein
VDTMKGAGLYGSQGGPIILFQIENEYGNIDAAYGAAGKAYMTWSDGMAVSLDTGVPAERRARPNRMLSVNVTDHSMFNAASNHISSLARMTK